MSSLRNTLLAWLLGAVALIGLGGAWVSYRNALAEANEFFDYHLRETAMLLRDQSQGFTGQSRLPQEVPEYDFVVQVWSLDGVRVYGSQVSTILQVNTVKSRMIHFYRQRGALGGAFI